MSNRIDVICSDCYYYINEEMRGNTPIGGGVRAGECHGVPPVVEKGWPVVEPINIGCINWKKGGVLQNIITSPKIPEITISDVDAPEEEPITSLSGLPGIKEGPCPSTNISASVERGSTISQKPGDESAPLSLAAVAKKLNESPAVLDSPSGGPSIGTNPTEKRQ